MFVMPILFLCGTLLFAVMLEERFKLITTLAISAIAYILALIANAVVAGMLTDPIAAGHIGHSIAVLIFFIASVFISSNNLAQKLFVGLLLISNYAFVTDFVPNLLGALPFSAAGIVSVLLANGIYILVSLLAFAFFSRPLHYFFRRSVSPSMIGLCLLQLLCWYCAKGGANELLNVASFPLRFFLTLFLYVIIIFCFRSIYGGARYKAKDVIVAADNTVMDIEADSFNTMLVNVNAYKSVKKNTDYRLDRISALAEAGKTKEICEYVALSKTSGMQSPLLGDYCDNPYINALIATKTAFAKSKGIRLDSNIALGDGNIKLVEICIVLNDILTFAIDEAEKAADEKYIRLNLLPTANQLTLEAVYTEGVAERKLTAPLSGTAFGILDSLFEKRTEDERNPLGNIADIIEKRGGKVNISHSDGTVITRVEINY